MARRDLGSQRDLAISSFNGVGWEGRGCLSASKEWLLFLLLTTSLSFVLSCVDQVPSLF